MVSESKEEITRLFDLRSVIARKIKPVNVNMPASAGSIGDFYMIAHMYRQCGCKDLQMVIRQVKGNEWRWHAAGPGISARLNRSYDDIRSFYLCMRLINGHEYRHKDSNNKY